MFVPSYPLADLKPASYNPRKISAEAFESLCDSLRSLGPIRPLIVTTGKTIIAGHQRTKAMRAIGIEACPAHVMPPVGLVDEVRFNQLHNAGDLEIAPTPGAVPPGNGWQVVPPSSLKIELRMAFAAKRKEVLALLSKYGEFSCAVATNSGELLVGQLYASACKVLGKPVRVCYVDDSLRDAVLAGFGRPYGEFSYDHLPRTTWSQAIVQPWRLRPSGSQKFKSHLYEDKVIPALGKDARVLDFGAGKKAYVHLLSERGYKIQGMEFFFTKKGERSIDYATVQRDISNLCADLARNGLFDVVVCDSVINSVDTLQAESDILHCLNGFCRPGGTIYFSGRRSEKQFALENKSTVNTVAARNVDFLDENGMTAMYRNGTWVYQKYHSIEQAAEMAKRFIGPGAQAGLLSSAYWYASGRKSLQLSGDGVKDAIAREFNLPYGQGKTYGRSKDIVAAYEAALALNLCQPN